MLRGTCKCVDAEKDIPNAACSSKQTTAAAAGTSAPKPPGKLAALAAKVAAEKPRLRPKAAATRRQSSRAPRISRSPSPLPHQRHSSPPAASRVTGSNTFVRSRFLSVLVLFRCTSISCVASLRVRLPGSAGLQQAKEVEEVYQALSSFLIGARDHHF